MGRRIALIIAAALVGVLHAGFVRALPEPASAVNLPLIHVIALVTSFRPIDALIAAASAGLAVDSLSSLPFGTETALLVALTAASAALFTRVFTHHSWQGTVGINLVAYALAGAGFVAVRAARATFGGFPVLSTALDATWRSALAATAAQLVAVLLAVLVAAIAKRTFSRYLFVRR